MTTFAPPKITVNMLKLNLELIQERNRFSIHLGGGKWLYFDNKTVANNYLRQYKRVLRDNVTMLNVLQPDINQMYRANYLFLPEDLIRSVSCQFSLFDEGFNRIWKVYSPGNKNAFVFKNVNTCFYSLISICEQLFLFAQTSKNYVLQAQIKPLLKHIRGLSSQFSNDISSLDITEDYLNVRQIKTLKLKVNDK